MQVFTVLLILSWSGVLLAAQIEPRLLSSLKAKDSANIFVSFHTGTSDVFKSIGTKTFTSRTEKINKIKAFLQDNADITQGRVLAYLKKNYAQSIQTFWISNQIYIENASSTLINVLANFAEVSKITEETIITLDTLIPTESTSHTTSDDTPTWGLKKIQVPEAWNMPGGNRGAGIVVGAIDSGVLRTHEALNDSFVGEYGWYDPQRRRNAPYDDGGHGTHTMGTIVGSHGIGVAPEAKWMACRGCRQRVCLNSELLACGQFMTCPTLTNGSNSDCSKAPHIVSNSWGGTETDDFNYSAVIEAWLAADIVPVFANGNRQDFEPICANVSYPADHPDVISVGNTDKNDGLDKSSDQGPTKKGYIKPDVSAPGTNVKSAYITTNRSYKELTGTSMACPHVAGVAALLLSHNINLKPNEVRGYLVFGNEQKNLKKPANRCGGVDEFTFPNNAFGHGRISAYNSLFKLINDPLKEFPKPTKNPDNGASSPSISALSITFSLFIYYVSDKF